MSCRVVGLRVRSLLQQTSMLGYEEDNGGANNELMGTDRELLIRYGSGIKHTRSIYPGGCV